MLAFKASQIAKEAMQEGYNCCESILIAANAIYNLDLPQESFDSAVYFREGMGSGCVCGALVGMTAVSGIIRARFNKPLDADLPKRLHKRFKEEFKSTCCGAIKKQRPILQRIGNKGCIDLTAKSAAILVEEWGDLPGAAD